jgi:RNA polymerase sigma factor (sigma-70 family)
VTATRQDKSNQRSTTDRILSQLTDRQREVYELIPDEIDYVWNESFQDKGAESLYFGDDAEEVDVPAWTHFPEVIEDVQPRSSKRTTLSAAQEKALFLQYNYARYRLSELIEAQNKRRTGPRAQKMVLWYQRAMNTRSKLVRANMALVLAMGKRTRIPNVEFTELISEGNMALLRSVEKFDVARGFKFSTYACRAILKSFNRLATKTGRYRTHFPTEFDPDLERSDWDVMKHDIQKKDSVEALMEIISRNRANLSQIERTVVVERFALGTDRRKGRTLAEVGKIVGLTNERVRQIQNLALGKIKDALNKEYLVA